MKLRKLLSLVLIISMLLSMVPVVYAEEEPEAVELTSEQVQDWSDPAEIPEVEEEPEDEIILESEEISEEMAAGIVDYGTCGENLAWTLDSEGTLKISGTGAMYSYGNIIYYTTPWSHRSSEIYTVIIEKGVTSIGDYAFSGCSGLTSITIPQGVTSIGDWTFSSCYSLTSITIPQGVTSIGDSAFCSCSSLTSITIPQGVTLIGCDAFYRCSSLTTINIPQGVTSIGVRAFEGCSSLTSISIPQGVTLIGWAAFAGCSSLTSITIPQGVTSIGYGTFSCCSSLTSITIPQGVTYIDDYAFSGCSGLTSITIPQGVTSIGDYAFKNCCSLKTIQFEGSMPSIGYNAFQDVSATAYYPPKNAQSFQYAGQYGGHITWSDGTKITNYRLYNPYTLEHMFCSSEEEKGNLLSIGWTYDGIAFNTPTTGKPVYRLYYPAGDWHTYSADDNEIAMLESQGWTVDGVMCQSSDSNGKPVYRMYNPYEKINFLLFTSGTEERDMLVSIGWQYQGIAWYVLNN